MINILRYLQCPRINQSSHRVPLVTALPRACSPELGSGVSCTLKALGKTEIPQGSTYKTRREKLLAKERQALSKDLKVSKQWDEKPNSGT